jgi:hypothetical protein
MSKSGDDPLNIFQTVASWFLDLNFLVFQGTAETLPLSMLMGSKCSEVFGTPLPYFVLRRKRKLANPLTNLY